MATVTAHTSVDFSFGMQQGKRRIFRENLAISDGEFCFAPGEEGVLEVIQNLIYSARDRCMTERQLRQDVGRIIGYALSHPHAF